VAISAKRLGAQEVSMTCLESMDIVPAIPEDIEQADEEGIEINCSWGPNRVLEHDGKLTGMEFVRCTSVFDKEGRFAPAFDACETATIEADQILVAIGQGSDLSYVGPELKTERGFIIIDQQTGGTSIAGVFAGGDVTGGPATAVQAMATGRQAAEAINYYLSDLFANATTPRDHSRLVVNEDALDIRPRVEVPRLTVPERTLMGEDARTLSREAMDQETRRCANCGCVAVNASDMAAALVALGANVRTTKRTLAAGELFTTAESRTTVLAPDELIEEIEIPTPRAGSRQAYLKFRIRNAIDFPIVGVAFYTDMQDGKFHNARVVLGAVAPVPMRVREVEELLEGQMPSEALAQEAGVLAAAKAQPLAHNKFKVEIVKGLLASQVRASK
jgi:CO/xanthine dehydrogenase FAD-binding subunit